ncbi:DUF6895 family protein [Streptomyces griseus]|uniref:DUF6895 family protein n=1 Tax=Streptomyces griseus TaxID=1911 RepID=UPI000AD16DC4|nr:hypothetical protein [Streptomyces griseus]
MTAAYVQELRKVEEAAFTWVAAHRDDFALGDDALAAEGHVNGSWKPLGELVRVCASVARRTAPTEPLHGYACDLLAYAWRQTRQGELFVRLQRCEPFATYPLEVYAAFAAVGMRHAGYEAAAATVARTRGWQLTEQVPTRRLGVLDAERRTGIRPQDETSPALGRTWPAGLPEPWTFERPSGYALTHVVFHLTDWGRDTDGVPTDLAAYLTDWLPPWLDTCLDAGMWDLSCELLAVAASLPDPPEPAALREAWARISAAQQATGALPEERGAADQDVRRDFTHCYHSTLMAAFAAALTLRRLDGAGDGEGDGRSTGRQHTRGTRMRYGTPDLRMPYDGQGARG